MINVFCVGPEGLNVGNEVISLALRKLVREAFDGQVNLVGVPASGDNGEWFTGLSARGIHEMNLYGHGVVVGGGNLYENGRLDVDRHALGRLQPPLLLCGLSHGRIYDRSEQLRDRTDSMPDDVIVALNGQAMGSLVRDEATLDRLRGLGLDGVALASCPSLLLSDVIDGSPPPAASPGALLSIRAPSLMSVPLHHHARVRDEVRRLVDMLEADGHGPVRLLCHDRRDIAFASGLDGVDYVVPDDVSTYLALLRAASLVVTFRLHAFLPCLSFGTPAVNISYDERSLSLVQTLGLGSWDVDFVREPDLVSVVHARVKRLDELTELTERARPRWDELAASLRAGIALFARDVRAYEAEAPIVT